MSLTQEQQIKIDNYKAQYNSILGDISVANSTLEELFQKVEKLEKDKKNLDLSIETKKSDLKLLTKDCNSLLLRKQEIQDATEKIERDHEATLEQIVNETKSAKKNYSAFIVKENRIIKSLQKTKDNLEAKIPGLKEGYETLLSKYDSIKDTVYKIGQEILEIEKEKKQVISDFNSQIKVKEKELSEITKLIEEEKKKIELPRLLFQQEQEKFELKKKNFEIIKGRFKRLFKEQFPDQNLVI